MITLGKTQVSNEHRNFLANLKKSVEFWNQTNCKYEDTAFEQINRSLLDIMLNDLIFPSENRPDCSENVEKTTIENALSKLAEDFEWLCRTTHIRNTFSDCIDLSHHVNVNTHPDPMMSSSCLTSSSLYNVKLFLHSWIARNLQSNCLCSCLQTLVTEKDLLYTYYNESAFMRNEQYTTALFICISAYELNQCSLLSQIDTTLYCPSLSNILTRQYSDIAKKHKRSSSHPIFSISPPKRTISSSTNNTVKEQIEYSTTITKLHTTLRNKLLPTLRKTKSLPPLNLLSNEYSELIVPQRPRSKTLTTKLLTEPSKSQPQDIPHSNFRNTKLIYSSNTVNNNNCAYRIPLRTNVFPLSSGSSGVEEFHNTPDSIDSFSSKSKASTSTASNSVIDRYIDLINCDDIKIWTDQSYEQENSNHFDTTTNTCDIPQEGSISSQITKSISPINSFLCSIFGTSPTYTNWSHCSNSSDINLMTDTTAVAATLTSDSTVDATTPTSRHHYPCNRQIKDNNSGVFDSFLPINGQKLRTRKSQNLFHEDLTNSTLTTNSINCEPDTITIKNTQSLTGFLQMSHLTRNNTETELEKENAHFRISEAIISAIEHIKWATVEKNKMQKYQKGKTSATASETTAATATDWLENDAIHRSGALNENHQQLSLSIDSNDHIPYIEFDENNSHLLSAEVVGLTLISKFDDKHLPKVSELKWLVSEDEAPQKLLPLPDNSSSANPDENYKPSITRGTKYWAPPRQQIIFTEHPITDRKQLIQKQNNRCAGCGMRVAPQYLRTFRYCTYLGKYFCTGCHRNQISTIPAKILHSWDFKCYPVSAFSYRLLDMMFTYPLFYVPDLNPALYINHKILLKAQNRRVQLQLVKEFIKACRFAAREQGLFDSIPTYITDDPDIWSLSDFIDVNNKSMQRSIDDLIEKCSNHIYNCVLCKARGFICEYCKNSKIIYPWESKRFRCNNCGSCFHMNCWTSVLEICYKCQRMKRRRDITNC